MTGKWLKLKDQSDQLDKIPDEKIADTSRWQIAPKYRQLTITIHSNIFKNEQQNITASYID